MSETKKMNGFARLAKDKNSKRLLMFGGVVVAASVGFAAMAPKKHAEISSVKPPVSSDSNIQGAKPVSDAYGKSLKEADQERTARALKEQLAGGAAMPTVQVAPKPDALPSNLGDDDVNAAAPATVAPPVLPPATSAANPFPLAAPPPVATPQNNAVPARQVVDPNLLEAMRRELAGADVKPSPAKTEWFYTPEKQGNGSSGSMLASKSSGYQAGAGLRTVSDTKGTDSTSVVRTSSSRFRTPVAGSIVYSHFIGLVNSDAPGTVIAEVLQGPFAGARLLGTFTTAEEGLMISFNTMTVSYTDEDGNKQSEVMPIKAVAVDTANLGSSLATDVNRHLLAQIAFSAATSFLQGFGQAISQSGSTAVLDNTGTSVMSNAVKNTSQEMWMAGGQAAGRVGQILQQQYGNRKTTITVAAGTPFGLLFLPTSTN